jgi:CsoR family transcriptional regulator, copper-sensing transcriptional repressor
MHGYSNTREAHLNRLRRIEGQVRGLNRMVTEDVYCIDVLTQVSAATRALQAFALELLSEHMTSCVFDAARSSQPEGRAKLEEAQTAIARLVRS